MNGPSPAERTCENCGAALLGDYCHHCGAPDVASGDRSFRSLLGELAEEFTSIEHSKVLRTMLALLFRPGLLTREYFTGRRIRYLRPLTLCLTILALHLFVYSATSVTMFDIGKTAAQSDSFLRSRGLNPKDSMSAQIARSAARQNLSVAALEDRINDRWTRDVSLFQIPMILLLAGVLKLAYLRSRRFAVEHFAFSTHYISFQVLCQVLMWPLYYVAGIDLSGATAALSVTVNAVSLLYLFVAVRTFYADTLRQALLRAPLIYLGYFFIFTSTYTIAMTLALHSALGPSGQ